MRHCPRGPAGGFPLLPSLLWFLPCYCLGGETEGGSRHHLLATDSLKPQHLGQHLLVLLQRCGAGDLFPRHGDRQTGWRWWGGKKRSRRASTTWWETVRPQRVSQPPSAAVGTAGSTGERLPMAQLLDKTVANPGQLAAAE